LHTVLTAVGAVATVWAVVSACDASVGTGSKPAVGKEALQNDIAARLANAGQQPQSVTCEHDLVGEVGKTARCVVVMSSTNSFEPVITSPDGRKVPDERQARFSPPPWAVPPLPEPEPAPEPATA